MTAKTDTAPYHGHRKWYVASFALAVLTLVWASLAARKHVMAGWDARLFRDINGWPVRWRTFFKVLSVSPNALWIGVGAVVLAFLARAFRLSWRLAAQTFAGFAVTEVLKKAINQPRPFAMLPHVRVCWTTSGSGFPSAHVMIVTVIMLSLLPYTPKVWRWLLPLPVVAVALSRVYLGAHSPLQVIGGFAVGLGVVSFVRMLPQTIKVALRLD